MENKQQTIVIERPATNGLAIAALVLGILGVVLNIIPLIPYGFGFLAIIFGVIGMNKPVGKGMAISGLILGIITFSMKILFWIGLFGLGNL